MKEYVIINHPFKTIFNSKQYKVKIFNVFPHQLLIVMPAMCFKWVETGNKILGKFWDTEKHLTGTIHR